ncbi:MAG: succinate dehydrogenase, cytochrome b556 subunit [Kangiellaceae bacterium]|nr:succinate dehydrogenase, cytochrome b556 subunit [Kangiellaceae bacterium]
MKTNRPGNVTLSTMAAFKWPITAISSILHRVTGVLLFLAVPFCLWTLERSLNSEAGFLQVKSMLSGDCAKFITWFILSSLTYHIIAGCKHLLMDVGIGESLESGVLASKLVIILGILAAVGLGVWIW